jgi:hypothetical protein
VYYEDRRIGSIHTMRELTRTALREHLTREQRGEQFAPVPPGATRVIEVAEALVAEQLARRAV